MQQCGFTRSRFTGNPEKFALEDLQRDVIERHKGVVPAEVGFDDILHLDDGVLRIVGHGYFENNSIARVIILMNFWLSSSPNRSTSSTIFS